MLKIIDPGCNKHNWSQLIMFGSKAELMKDILYNLPQEGGFHTFICEHGHTHHVRFQVKAEKVGSGYAWEWNILDGPKRLLTFRQQIMVFNWGLIKAPKTSLIRIICPGMEKREYPRIDMDLPMAYLIQSPDSSKSLAGMAVLKNISQGGIFFKCPPPLPIDDGDIRNFSIDTTPITRHISRLKVLGKVVRIEPPAEDSFDFGIAVQFLSGLKIELRN